MGSEQIDQIQNFVGNFVGIASSSWPQYQAGGAFSDSVSIDYIGGSGLAPGVYQYQKINFDPSRVARTGSENTMKNRAALPLVKVS